MPSSCAGVSIATCGYDRGWSNHGRGCGTASPRLTRLTAAVWLSCRASQGRRRSPNPSGAVLRVVYLLLHPSSTHPHWHPTRPGHRVEGGAPVVHCVSVWGQRKSHTTHGRPWPKLSVASPSRELVSEPSADAYKMAHEPRCRRPHHPSIRPDLVDPGCQSPARFRHGHQPPLCFCSHHDSRPLAHPWICAHLTVISDPHLPSGEPCSYIYREVPARN